MIAIQILLIILITLLLNILLLLITTTQHLASPIRRTANGSFLYNNKQQMNYK